MSTVALEKVASDVAKGATPHCVARLMHELLTPKIGVGKRLTRGLNLVEEHHSAEGFPQSIW
jgi:hypothetical protein